MAVQVGTAMKKLHLCAHHGLCSLSSTGNRWAGPFAPYPSHRSRVHGLEVGPCHQALPSHREDQVCFLWAVCQLRTSRGSRVFEAQFSKPFALLSRWLQLSWGCGPCKCWLAFFALSGKEDMHWGSASSTKMALLQWKYDFCSEDCSFQKLWENNLKTVDSHEWKSRVIWTAPVWFSPFCPFPL